MWKPPTNLNSPDVQKHIAQTKAIGLKLVKMPIVWAAILGIAIYIAVSYPNWERKANLYDVLTSGRASMICLSHENSIFERSSMSKSFATTKAYIRFDRETFIHDFLKREASSITFLAMVVDLNGIVYWSEMTQKENQDLSQKFKIELGTCLAAKNFHMRVPGAALVTNQ